ncbi:hypothetical protein T09_5922 [Trichinella sp. T9]|nr:hypothetical protein T09_5922 [Trichinella sp. T9]
MGSVYNKSEIGWLLPQCVEYLSVPKTLGVKAPCKGIPLSVCGEQPIVLATAWVVWGFPWDPFGQQLN